MSKMKTEKESKVTSKRLKKKIKGIDRRVLSFFLLGFPSLLIAIADLWIQIGLIFYQLIMLKQFVDDYYKY